MLHNMIQSACAIWTSRKNMVHAALHACFVTGDAVVYLTLALPSMQLVHVALPI